MNILLDDGDIDNIRFPYSEAVKYRYEKVVAKAQLKKVWQGYEDGRYSTPEFVHLVIPRQALLKEIKG